MSHADADDLASFFDERIVADLVSDSGTPDEAWRANPKLTTMLEAASGRVEAACTVANIYLTTDLAALAGNSLALLKEIVCTLTMAMLVRRRQGRYREEYKEKIEEAEAYLDRLRKGERVFGMAANQDAGVIGIEGATVATYQKLNLLPDRTLHYYPDRARRLPTETIG